MTEWTAQRIAHLRRRWSEGATAGTIARELGERFGGYTSRSAVIGKCHRLKLLGRPNPIKSRDPAATAAKRKATIAAVVKSGDHAMVCQHGGAGALKRARERSAQAAAKPAATINVKPIRSAAQRLSDYKHCQFIEGTGRPWTKCGAPTVPGHSWCEAHCQRVYKPREAAQTEGEAA